MQVLSSFVFLDTTGIETSAILHFGSALTMRELCLQNSGSNSSTQTGYGLAANT